MCIHTQVVEIKKIWLGCFGEGLEKARRGLYFYYLIRAVFSIQMC